MEIDHVLLAVRELEAAAQELATRHGLASYEGGRHPGWGTANWIVPLGDAYLELVAVVDERQAQESDFGRWVSGVGADRLVGWAVRPRDLTTTARRLGLEISAGARTRPLGEHVEWRMAGVQEVARRPWLPFFIEWAEPGATPGATATPNTSLVRLEIDCARTELDDWLGEHDMPLTVRNGRVGLTGVVLRGPGGTVTLGGGSPL